MPHISAVVGTNQLQPLASGLHRTIRNPRHVAGIMVTISIWRKYQSPAEMLGADKVEAPNHANQR